MIDMRMAKILYHLSIPNQKCKIKIIISFAIISICLFPASKSDAVYPVTIDPVIVEMKKILAWDAEEEDHFGFSVAISGDTVVVGVPLEDTASDNAGAVYIFARDQGGANNWGRVKKIVAWDAEAYDRFGYSVAISGDTVVMGVPYEDTGSYDAGAAYIARIADKESLKQTFPWILLLLMAN